jgi:hypothetical protein
VRELSLPTRLVICMVIASFASLEVGVIKRAAAIGDTCELKPHAVIRVVLPPARYPHILAHVRYATSHGWPRVLVVNRRGAAHRRDVATSVLPTRPGFDRDEYPAAVGRTTLTADVRYVPSGENRSQGATMGARLAPFCDGQRFRLVAGAS